MKKTAYVFLTLCLILVLSACDSDKTQKNSQNDSENNAEISTGANDFLEPDDESEPDRITKGDEASDFKILVVYFSVPETTNYDNTTEEDSSAASADGEVLGDTEYLAYVIQENTGADIFRIEPETPYPTDYDTLVSLMQTEQNEGARPVIKDHVENIEEYDTIFLGYPNWWDDIPMILYSFLEEYDLSGKTIIPFSTNSGSGVSDTIGTIAELEPDAYVSEEGFAVSKAEVQSAESDIISWLKGLGYIK